MWILIRPKALFFSSTLHLIWWYNSHIYCAISQHGYKTPLCLALTWSTHMNACNCNHKYNRGSLRRGTEGQTHTQCIKAVDMRNILCEARTGTSYTFSPQLSLLIKHWSIQFLLSSRFVGYYYCPVELCITNLAKLKIKQQDTHT